MPAPDEQYIRQLLNTAGNSRYCRFQEFQSQVLNRALTEADNGAIQSADLRTRIDALRAIKHSQGSFGSWMGYAENITFIASILEFGIAAIVYANQHKYPTIAPSLIVTGQLAIFGLLHIWLYRHNRRLGRVLDAICTDPDMGVRLNELIKHGIYQLKHRSSTLSIRDQIWLLKCMHIGILHAPESPAKRIARTNIATLNTALVRAGMLDADEENATMLNIGEPYRRRTGYALGIIFTLGLSWLMLIPSSEGPLHFFDDTRNLIILPGFPLFVWLINLLWNSMTSHTVIEELEALEPAEADPTEHNDGILRVELHMPPPLIIRSSREERVDEKSSLKTAKNGQKTPQPS